MVGGFLILFSVLNSMLALIGVTALLAGLLGLILPLFQISTELSIPLISGIFEITLGGKLTSEVMHVSLMDQIIITSFFLAFSGLSVQAQVASILAESDIRFKPFFFARIMHGCLAALITFLLWKPIDRKLNGLNNASVDLPVFAPYLPAGFWEQLLSNLGVYGPLFTLIVLWVYLIILLTRRSQDVKS
jgi:nucleoside recognition membrane protein YjiH